MSLSKHRFAKQIRRNDCAPNVIINLMKYFGVKVSYKTGYKRLYDYFNIPAYNGTHPVDLHTYLVDKKPRNSKLVSMQVNPPIQEIARNISKKRVMVVAFHSGPQMNGHVFLLAGINKNGFQAVNYSARKTIQTIPFDRFQKEVLDFNKVLTYTYERKK